MWKFLEHTADTIIEAKGRDINNTLEELCRGLFELMGRSNNKLSFNHSHSFYFSYDEVGIITLLNDIISYSEENNLLPYDIHISNGLADVFFSTGTNTKVKAATFHDLFISKHTIRVTIDI